MLLIVSPADLRTIVRDDCNLDLPRARLRQHAASTAEPNRRRAWAGQRRPAATCAEAAHPRRRELKRIYAANANVTALREDWSLLDGMQPRPLHRRALLFRQAERACAAIARALSQIV